MISKLRSLGLTIKEIERFGRAYLSDPEEPIGPRLAALLDGAEQRIADQIADLTAARRRIRDYRARHAAALAGRSSADLLGPDPRQQQDTA